MKGIFEEPNQIIVKHFAVMMGKGILVNERDLKIIDEKPEVHDFYTQCLDEVQKLKENKVIGCISFFDIVNRTFKELSFLARNDKFVENFYASESKNLFPLFYKEMDLALKNAVECRNKLKSSEEALRESLSDILPELVLDKITFYIFLNELY